MSSFTPQFMIVPIGASLVILHLSEPHPSSYLYHCFPSRLHFGPKTDAIIQSDLQYICLKQVNHQYIRHRKQQPMLGPGAHSGIQKKEVFFLFVCIIINSRGTIERGSGG